MESTWKPMKVNSDEIRDYIASVTESIEKAIPQGYALNGGIKFKIGVRNSIQLDGSLKLLIVGVGANRTSEQDASFEFEILNPLTQVIQQRVSQVSKEAVGLRKEGEG
jgi:hypothetical protein